MTDNLQQSLWQQFGACIDMLINAIASCPYNYFVTHKRFYYLAYHSAVFLDYYSSIPARPFSPVLSFTVQPPDRRPEESIGDMIPDKIYSKDELLGYVQSTRIKCKRLIDSLANEESFTIRFTEGNEKDDMDYSLLEIMLYNLRHTQHHVGQLNLLIRQDLDKHMEWIFRADEPKQKRDL